MLFHNCLIYNGDNWLFEPLRDRRFFYYSNSTFVSMKEQKMRDVIKLSDIKPHPINPRTISPADFEKLKRSLQRDPEIMTVNPIVLNSKKDFTILAGEQRYKALLELGYQEIPGSWVLLADHLTDEQRQKFILLDNHHSGIWDIGKLTENFGVDLVKGWEIAIPDFSVEIPELLSVTQKENKQRSPGATDDDYSIFELVMLHENKVELLDILNQVRQDHKFEKIEEALMHIVHSYTP